MDLRLPNEILKKVNKLNYKIDHVGKSKDKVIIFEDKYTLKISKNIDCLKNEYEKSIWLKKYLKSPKPVLFLISNKKAYFLKTFIKGKSLIDKEFVTNPKLLINYIVKAYNMLKKVDNLNCPFKSNDSIGTEFVHGDICLPNIIVNNNKISGFIDLDNSGLGDRWYDYSWSLWSLTRNLKTNKYNELLLKKLNIEFDKEKFDKYIPDELKDIFYKKY